MDVVLLGEPFLIAEEAQIDYKEATVRIANRIIFLDPISHEFNQGPDAELMAKIFCAKKQVPGLFPNERIIIEKFNSTNPELGTIPNHKMSIELTEHTPIHRYPFPIPFKVQESVKEEINRLLS